MSKLAWKPWHEVVKLREDLKSGQLSLAMFAADLYDVMMGQAKPVYQDAREFFSLTYPTFNLRELAKDIILRLLGQNDKAVRQLELTYGGGKTHTLIALYHLVKDPASLPDLPSVHEFTEHIGQTPPKARVAVLAFDKLDVEKGMEVLSPEGKKRWLKHPWSVLAFQIAGSKGLKLLHAEEKDEERESAPAENLLCELLALPAKEKLATLILIDEVLMYAREKIGFEPGWRTKLVNFFQYLTQAATKVDHCAVVASLLATDPKKSDILGKEITQEMYAIFRREREEGVQPVLKEDVAEVLRRRFFTPDSIRDRESFRPHVVAAFKGISELDDQTKKEGKTAEERFLKSYPFHPDLTDVFYTKWTNLEGFQRTRGILRIFALALRYAGSWDLSPLVGANVFLNEPEKEGISEAARELTTIAATEEHEGKKQEWTGILEGELTKAREIQNEMSGLKFRELEQAVFATFLHSQPIGQKALTRELLLLLGSTRPDKIELEKALQRWKELSWFLDEDAIVDSEQGASNKMQLPKSWRLGSKPNLKQMHHDACTRIQPALIDLDLLEEIGRLRSLGANAAAAGAKTHILPKKPSDIEDDGEFHYAVLGPEMASEVGKPHPEAKRFINETTAEDRPRTYRNAIVLAVPSKDGIEAVRNYIREKMGWEEVESQLKKHEIDPIRRQTLDRNIETCKKKIPEAVRQAYSIAITVSDKNEIQAIKINISGAEPLFNLIKSDKRNRIQDTPVNADALLPGGPYDLWQESEKFRRFKDLVSAFAYNVKLPKMLRSRQVLDTLIAGEQEGLFVFRITRPDRTVKTYWRQEPDESSLRDPALEVVLPEAAILSDIAPPLLALGVLPGLWESDHLLLKGLYDYFIGGRVVKVVKNGYEDSLSIPKAERNVIDASVFAAVKTGKIWLTADSASFFSEDVPAGILNEEARMQAPPKPIAPAEILPDKLKAAWREETTTAQAIALAFSEKVGKTIPWPTILEAIEAACRARFLEVEEAAELRQYSYLDAKNIKLKLPSDSKAKSQISPPPPPPKDGVLVGEAKLETNQIQDLADVIGDLVAATAGHSFTVKVRMELDGAKKPTDEVISKVNAILEKISKDLKLGR